MSAWERIFDGLVLCAAAVPPARLVASAHFRRAFPRATASLALGIAIWVGISAWAAAALPPAFLRGGAALVLAGLLVTVVLARPGRGASRGWPPGSLGLVRSMALLTDPAGYRRRAAAHGPVFKARQYRNRVACVVGLQRGMAALRDNDRALSVPPLPFDRLIPGRFLRYMDPAAHREKRAILREAFPDRVVDASVPFLRRETRRALAELSAASLADPRGAAPRERIGRLVHDLFARLFFGVEPRTAAAERLERLYDDLDPYAGSRDELAREARALARIRSFVDETVEGWEQGAEPPAHCFLRALAEARPEAARDPTIVANLAYLLATSSGDVTGLLPWILVELSANPAWVERVRDEAAPPDLSRRVVLETLRLEQSEFLYRRVDRPIEVDGLTIPAGWLLRICVRESHRDPAIFPDPDRFDPDRFADRMPPATEYSPFGASRLMCLGRGITLEVGRVFVEELCRGFHWTIVEDGPRELGGRHWDHWRPSRRLRIRLEASGVTTSD